MTRVVSPERAAARREQRSRPCARCGVRCQPRQDTTVGICLDCRAVDPAYVRAVASGVPIIARSA